MTTMTMTMPKPIPMPETAGADALALSADRAALRDARLRRGARGEVSTPSRIAPGHTLLLFLEDPVRYKETLDLAVIVPEIARAFPGRFAVGVLLPEAARALHPRFGFRRWPAFVLLKRRASTSARSTACATGTNT